MKIFMLPILVLMTSVFSLPALADGCDQALQNLITKVQEAQSSSDTPYLHVNGVTYLNDAQPKWNEVYEQKAETAAICKSK